ncbi:hypothetical protein U1Q18_014230 [Sarracenia purpurea var. burkii]
MGEEEGEEEGGRESDHHHRRRPTTGTPLAMLAHKFVEQSILSDLNLRRHKPKKAWWSLGWSCQSDMDESEPATW